MNAERFADNDGIKIRYLDHDPTDAEGHPIVLVPGIVDSADDYMEALDCAGARRFVVIELRGRGGSDAPPGGYSAEEQAGDIQAVLDAAGIGAFHLMTFSRGTTPALTLAFRVPERVLTVSIGDYLPGEVGLTPDLVDRMWTTTWRGRPVPDRVSRHVLEGIQGASHPREFWGPLVGLGVPVLVARPTDNGIVGDEQEKRYRDAVPGVEVVTIPGSGHDLFRWSRTAYPAAVLDFISRVRPGT